MRRVLRAAIEPLWLGIGRQLRRPSGLSGRLTGRFMTIANAKPYHLALSALDLRESENLIELGCGPGDGLRRLLRRRGLGETVGLDWSPAMLAQAARRNREALREGRLMLVRGDFADLPLEDRSLDAVLGVNVAYFMTDAAPLREAHRVLRVGGRIVLYATEREAMRRWRFASRHSHRLYSETRLAAALADAGFARESIVILCVDAGFGVKGLIAKAYKEA